ncbi:hypothetical protein [Halobacteriovorax sp. ZH2_bin.1]|uniref:hypothetical protein n=1 Tax=Halobacteriovorax sp. ZH2_bin.1 TaxID=3157724 RepID=UPI00371DD89F
MSDSTTYGDLAPLQLKIFLALTVLVLVAVARSYSNPQQEITIGRTSIKIKGKGKEIKSLRTIYFSNVSSIAHDRNSIYIKLFNNPIPVKIERFGIHKDEMILSFLYSMIMKFNYSNNRKSVLSQEDVDNLIGDVVAQQ